MAGSLDSVLALDVERARGGDEGAFSRLVERTHSMVCAIAFAVVGDAAASEDIAQDVYLSAWKGFDKLRNPRSFLPWLRQMTRNQAKSWLRRLYVRRERDHRGDEALAGVADPSPSAQASLEERENLELVARALEEIPDEAREVVVLYYREGRSTTQVAELLGLSEAAVRQRLSRGRRLIREDVEARVRRGLEQTAPGWALVSTVVASVMTTTGPASAVVSGTVGVRGFTLGGLKLGGLAAMLSALPGVLAGAGGVIFGLRSEFKEALDEEEIRQLRRFRTVAVLAVVLAGLGFVGSAGATHWWPPTAVFSMFLIALGVLYFGWLPRIVARRLAYQLATDPRAVAKQRRRRRIALFGFLLGAASGGLGLLAGLFWTDLLG
ncbi:MAG: RNA polymerase sigma factor [Thermoanaerobaculia bacterium]|nr:RNA polymerase sigma factor [Thermoanaerobaculia bacterium]